MRLFVPRDAAARALGADAVARALAREAEALGLRVEIVRTGSRGMIWLEPLVEVERDGTREAHGPLRPDQARDLLTGRLAGLGRVEDIPFFARQTRLTFARVGLNDPLDLAAYRATGGLAGLAAALSLRPEAIVGAVRESGLRGRGGAGFPAGIKWETVRSAPGGRKHVVCNADEGDSGSFADRMLMEGDPFLLIEGMAIAGLATGAESGIVYIRSEYPDAIAVMGAAIARAEAGGLLGPSLLGSGRAFALELRVGAGSYVCGEETALINSIEGRRGIVRAKPPLPALAGLFGRPTLVHNVLTLAAVPFILAEGAAAYAAHGLGRSRGTIPVQLAGNVARGGLFETGLGMRLGTLVHEIGGGTASGRPVKAVQVGGPLGAYLRPDQFDTPFGYEEMDGAGGILGHAGITLFDESADMGALARFAMEFCAVESCGKCTPCRIGAVRGVETIERILAGAAGDVPLLEDLCETMREGSLCALGGFAPYPVLSALRGWPEDFGLPPQRREAAE